MLGILCATFIWRWDSEVRVRAVAVIGFKGSGKTTVASYIVGELKRRGLRVAAVKHAHGGISVNDEDSGRLFGAGADRVIAVSDDVVEEYRRSRASLWEVISQLRGFDFAVFEGFKSEFPGVRLAVARNVEEARELLTPLTVAITGRVAKEDHSGLPVPVFDLESEGERLVDFLLEKAFEPLPGLNCGFCRYGSCVTLAEAIARGEAGHGECTVLSSKVKLLVDGKPVELNPFVQDVFRNVVFALVGSLKGVGSSPSRVELRVER